MVEAAKKVANMWMKMAQLIRSEFNISQRLLLAIFSPVTYRKECVLKERRFKEDIVDLAKSINKESQQVARIARSTAEACTDERMKNVSRSRILPRHNTMNRFFFFTVLIGS